MTDYDELSKCREWIQYRLDDKESMIERAPGSQRYRRTRTDEVRSTSVAWFLSGGAGIGQNAALKSALQGPPDRRPIDVKECHHILGVTVALLIEWIDGVQVDAILNRYLAYLGSIASLRGKKKDAPPFLGDYDYPGMAHYFNWIITSEKTDRADRQKRALQATKAKERAKSDVCSEPSPAREVKLIPPVSNEDAVGRKRKNSDDSGKYGHWW